MIALGVGFAALLIVLLVLGMCRAGGRADQLASAALDRREVDRARRGIDPSKFAVVDQLDDAEIFVFPRNGAAVR